MRGKGPRAPIHLLLQLVLFGRKKTIDDPIPVPMQQTTARLDPFPIPETIRKTVTDADIAKARNKLRVANLERDIIGDALTKIYEAESKGTINDSEKNQMIQPYKNDLKRVDAEIDTYKKTVDLYELEAAKEDLFKRFQETFLEIQSRIEKIKPSLGQLATAETTIEEKPVPNKPEPEQTEETLPQKEKPSKEKPRNKAEEKIETIREEVLKAMERLEQIETEG